MYIQLTCINFVHWSSQWFTDVRPNSKLLLSTSAMLTTRIIYKLILQTLKTQKDHDVKGETCIYLISYDPRARWYSVAHANDPTYGYIIIKKLKWKKKQLAKRQNPKASNNINRLYYEHIPTILTLKRGTLSNCLQSATTKN